MPLSSKAFLEATCARQAEEERHARMARYDTHVKAQNAKKKLRKEMRASLDAHGKTLGRNARQNAARLAAPSRTGGSAPRLADEATIKRAFEYFDKDHSGTIDVQELGGALEMVLGRRPAPGSIQKLFEIADEDGSGELDLMEWTKVAKRGELVDKEILHPKYRLMMEIKRRRAGARDASIAAVVAKSAQIEEARRVATATKQTWKVQEERRLRNSIEKRKGLRLQQLSLKKANDDMKRRGDIVRSKERKAKTKLNVQNADAGVGHELYRAMEERARKRCLDAIIEATLCDVDQDFARTKSTRTNAKAMGRFYVGAQQDLAVQKQRAAKSKRIKEANARSTPDWFSTRPQLDAIQADVKAPVYTEPPPEIAAAVAAQGFDLDEESASDDDGAMPAELRRVRFDDRLDSLSLDSLSVDSTRFADSAADMESGLDSAAALQEAAERRRTGSAERQKRQRRDASAATLLQASERRRTARVDVHHRRRARDDSAATLLQASERRRTARADVQQRRESAATLEVEQQNHSAATLLQASERRRTARADVQQRRQVRDDSAATLLQGLVRRRNAKDAVHQWREEAATFAADRRRAAAAEARRREAERQEEQVQAERRREEDWQREEEALRLAEDRHREAAEARRRDFERQEEAARGDSAATMLQASLRRRNAKEEVQQLRHVRDDGAATKLQGSVRRRNAKHEVSQKRQRRANDNAATMLQASERRRTARVETQARRQVRDDRAAEEEAHLAEEKRRAEAEERRREFERQEELRQAEAEAELRNAREAAEARRRKEDEARAREEAQRREADEARRRDFERQEAAAEAALALRREEDAAREREREEEAAQVRARPAKSPTRDSPSASFAAAASTADRRETAHPLDATPEAYWRARRAAEGDVPVPSPPGRGLCAARVRRAFAAESAQELALAEGERVLVRHAEHDTSPGWIFAAKGATAAGYVPRNYLIILRDDAAAPAPAKSPLRVDFERAKTPPAVGSRDFERARTPPAAARRRDFDRARTPPTPGRRAPTPPKTPPTTAPPQFAPPSPDADLSEYSDVLAPLPQDSLTRGSRNSRRGGDEQDETVDSQAKLYIGCQTGNFAMARKALKYGADVYEPNEHGFTALFLACENGHFDLARLMLDRGADVDEGASASGRTPLHEACYAGHIELVKLLLAHNAMLVEDEDGDTPLMDAESEGHADIVALLMERKAKAGRDKLPDGWEELFDPESGQPFYHHEASSTTQWERPDRPESSGAPGV